MKFIYALSILIFLLNTPIKAETIKIDTSQNPSLPFKFDRQIDQSVVFNGNGDSKPDYVLLLKPDDSKKLAAQDLVVFISNHSGYTEVLKLPSFWNSWGSAIDDSSAPKLELSGDEKKNFLIVTITDSSDDQANQILKFRWEKNTFRLIGETKSATPRDNVKSKTGESMSGRWKRTKDINWLTGKQIIKCDLKPKLKSGHIKPKYITIIDYHMSVDYLDDSCY